MPHTASRLESGLERQIRRTRRRLHDLERARDRFARFRPYIFFSGLGLTFWLGWLPLVIALVLITLDLIYYNRIGQIMRRHQIWLDIKTTQLARIRLNWEQIPDPPEYRPDEQHPFEVDLNVTGPKSLHHLVDMAVSRGGSERLRHWLLQMTPDQQTISARQQILQELRPLARFRDKLLLHFRQLSKEQLDGDKLLHWLHIAPPLDTLRRALPVALGLTILNLILFTGNMLGWMPGYWVLSFAVYIAVYLWYTPTLKQSFDAVMLLDDELAKFRTILRYFENYPYANYPHLKQVCQPFWDKTTRPSTQLRNVTLLTTAVGLRMNPVLGLFLNIVPWDILVGFLIHRCQQQCAARFPRWVDTWSELEALISLSNFAYLAPEYIFPDVRDEIQPQQPIFQAANLGHPLIPKDHKICNDFAIQHIGDLTLITGSNMAGKSTFLKTIGINLCLAYAGGTVNASAFHVSRLRLFTCMNIHDSITDGFSFFYAEVRRLKRLLEVVQEPDQPPVLFLIDEIFKGTNSRERLIGSQAYIHFLATQPAVGLIATHDLELSQLEGSIPGLRNAHFRDDVAEGKMVFDYKIHAGPCPTTNAVKIMRMEGLPVP